jgi:hypothetical protein
VCFEEEGFVQARDAGCQEVEESVGGLCRGVDGSGGGSGGLACGMSSVGVPGVIDGFRMEGRCGIGDDVVAEAVWGGSLRIRGGHF